MECRLPEPLRDEQLLAYLDGEATPAVAHHLESCPACRARLQALSQSERRLLTTFYRRDCPPPLALGEYKLALLPSAEQLAIAQHVTQCPHCALEVAHLEDFLVAVDLAVDRSVDRHSAAAAPPFLGLAAQARLVVARLRDSWPNFGSSGALTPALAGVRGTEDVQQIFDTGEGVQIIVDSQLDEAAKGQRTLLGLIVGVTNPGEVTAALWQAERWIGTTAVDGLGNFVLTALGPGTYTLLLSNHETVYQINDLEL